MKEFNLREELRTLKDKRRKQAQYHPIDVVLMITIMATMSGYQGYRAIGDFVQIYKKELIEYLELKRESISDSKAIKGTKQKE